MKRTLRFLSIIACACTVQAGAQYLTVSNVQMLDALNEVGNAEAYPWISADGLRLYYTKQYGAQGTLKLSTRPDLASVFNTSITIAPLDSNDQVAGWLSPDELTVWYESEYLIRRSTRPNTGTTFDLSEPITVNGITDFMLSPALTPDAEQMVVFSSTGLNLLHRTGPAEYTFSSIINTGLPDAGPARLSADGLVIYFDAVHNGVDVPHRMSRTSFAAPFGNLQYFTGGELQVGYSWSKVHLAVNESVLVGNRNNVDLWEGNELFIADVFSTAGIEEAWLDASALTPNPADANVRIAPPAGWNKYTISLVDASGRICLQQQLSGAASLDLAHHASGIYSVELTSDAKVLRQRLVIAHE